MVILWVCYGYPMVLGRKRVDIGSKTDREKPNPGPSLKGREKGAEN